MQHPVTRRPLEQSRRDGSRRPAAWRATAWAVAALVAALVAVPTMLLTVVVAPAHAEESRLPTAVRTVGDDAALATITVPEGIIATSLSGQISTDSTLGGEVVVLVGDREVARVPPGPDQDIAFPLQAEDLEADRTLELAMRYEIPATPTGCPSLEPATTELNDLRLGSVGSETAPTSSADFFPATATRIDVQVPRNASDDMLTAGMTAVAALGALYPEGTEIVLGSPGTVLPRTGIGQRVVKLEPVRDRSSLSEDGTSTTVTEKFGLQTLVLAGSGEALVDATRDLGSSLRDLAETGEALGLSAQPGVRDPDASLSLADLGLDDVLLSGVGLGSASVAIPQDAFGGPLERLDLDVVGTHTAVDPAAKAQLNTYVNDYLVDSQLLGKATALTIEASVPAARLRPVNDVRFTLAALPVDGVCADPDTELPLEVTLDPERSSVAGTPGAGTATGFGLYPQVLAGSLPIGVRGKGRSRVSAVADAAQLVLPLQRAAAAPLEVEVVQADSLLAGDQGGLLVGADQSDSEALQTPVPLSAFRQVDAEGRSFGVDDDDPFAALQAAGPADRPLLVLGSWSRGQKPGARSLVQTVLDRVVSDGWSSLDGNVLIAHGDDETFALDVAVTVPPPPLEDEPGHRVAWWVLPGIVVLLVLLVVQVRSHARREGLRTDRSRDRPDDGDPAPDQRAMVSDDRRP